MASHCNNTKPPIVICDGVDESMFIFVHVPFGAWEFHFHHHQTYLPPNHKILAIYGIVLNYCVLKGILSYMCHVNENISIISRIYREVNSSL